MGIVEFALEQYTPINAFPTSESPHDKSWKEELKAKRAIPAVYLRPLSLIIIYQVSLGFDEPRDPPNSYERREMAAISRDGWTARRDILDLATYHLANLVDRLHRQARYRDYLMPGCDQTVGEAMEEFLDLASFLEIVLVVNDLAHIELTVEESQQRVAEVRKQAEDAELEAEFATNQQEAEMLRLRAEAAFAKVHHENLVLDFFKRYAESFRERHAQVEGEDGIRRTIEKLVDLYSEGIRILQRCHEIRSMGERNFGAA